jgi:preprotein translocase subunit YajC
MKKIFYSLPLLATAALFAEEAAPAVNNRSNLVQTMVTIGVAILFFYFLLWRPEQKRRKKLEQQRGALKKGDRVTAMGIVGTVLKIQDGTVILRMVDGAKLEMLKGSITDVQPGSEEDIKKAEET